MGRDSDLLDILVTHLRNARDAKHFLRKLLKVQGGSAMAVGHVQAVKLCGHPPRTPPIGYLSNRAVHEQRAEGRTAHQEARRSNASFHEAAAQVQRLLTVHPPTLIAFRLSRHRLKAIHHQLLRERACTTCKTSTGVPLPKHHSPICTSEPLRRKYKTF